MEERVFTPRISLKSQERITMHLSEEDWPKIKRGTWKAIVTNIDTGKRYAVKGAACSLPHCKCDAVITAEII